MSYTADSAAEGLLAQARQGDGDALGELLELYRGYLKLLARVQIGRRLQGKADSADLVQETFLTAHEVFAQFRGTTEREMLAWLRQILSSRLAKLLRRYLGTQQRDVRLERRLDEELGNSSQVLGKVLALSQTSPSQKAVRREDAVLLADALSRLPEHYREVIVLRHLEARTFPEVAERMGRSVDSVEKLWVRALGQLRQAVGGTQ